jgi:probable F420-dependent oxidoreductase
VLAALGPKMLELARDRAAGAHPYLVTPEHTAQARRLLGDGPLLAVEQAVVLTDDADVVRTRAHWHLEIYTGLANYRASWLRQGFADDDLVRGGSDRLKGAMVVAGEDAIARRVREHLDAGADHVCLQVLGDDVFTPPVDDWARLAPVAASLR